MSSAGGGRQAVGFSAFGSASQVLRSDQSNFDGMNDEDFAAFGNNASGGRREEDWKTTSFNAGNQSTFSKF